MTADLDLIKYHSSTQLQPVCTDVSMMTDDQKELLNLAHNSEWRQTKFKNEWFVGEAQLTPFAKLRQWLMELKSRENNIETIEYEIARFEAEEKILRRDAENETDDLKRELILIDALKKHKDWNRSKLRTMDIYKERQELMELVERFLASDEGKTPDGRPLTAVFGTPEEAEYEKQYWTVRLARQAALDMSAYGRIGSGNLEAILMCSNEQQTEIVALANHLNLTYDQRQNAIRTEVARRLGMLAGKSYHIGELHADLLNAALDVDRAAMIEELNNKNGHDVPQDL
jgi:nicotinamide riboside kinase